MDCALGRLGLPGWFRKVYFSFHSQVRLWFKLAAGLGEPWCRDGGIPQGCPLSMIFIVALYVPWCRHLESLPDVKPQLYADNLKCSSYFGVASVGALLLGFQVKLGLVRGKYLHAAEASYVSSSSISAFRAAIVRAVWSS